MPVFDKARMLKLIASDNFLEFYWATYGDKTDQHLEAMFNSFVLDGEFYNLY